MPFACHYLPECKYLQENVHQCCCGKALLCNLIRQGALGLWWRRAAHLGHLRLHWLLLLLLLLLVGCRGGCTRLSNSTGDARKRRCERRRNGLAIRLHCCAALEQQVPFYQLERRRVVSPTA